MRRKDAKDVDGEGERPKPSDEAEEDEVPWGIAIYIRPLVNPSNEDQVSNRRLGGAADPPTTILERRPLAY